MSVGFSELQSNLVTYLPTIVLGTVAVSALDLAPLATGSTKQLPIFLYSMIGMFVTLTATAAAWKGLTGQYPQSRMTVGSYIGASFVSGLGILLGLVLLVLPGLFLIGRWSLYLIIQQAEGASAMESLRRSWDLTERDWLAATIILIISALLNFGGSALVPSMAGQGWPLLVAGTLVGNTVATAGSVWGCIATVAMYRFIIGSVSQVDEIFG